MTKNNMNIFLRCEGAALFLATLVAYYALGGGWLMFIGLFLVPDIGFAGYLVNPRVGAYFYNAIHSTIAPLALGAIGWWFVWPLGITLAVIWLSHIGADRMLGYGLKHRSGFKNTHLGTI